VQFELMLRWPGRDGDLPFLRTAAGTLIPSIAVPLSLVGTFGLMYLAGFSVEQPDADGAPLATGSSVDDVS